VRQVPPPAPGVTNQRPVWPWVVGGGCALGCVLVVVTTIVLGFAGVSLAGHSLLDRLKHGGFSCLPSDFPAYPGATLGGESFSMNAPSPGNQCLMTYETHDSVSTVLDFYQSRLSRGGWQVAATDAPSGRVEFRNAQHRETTGVVTAVTQNDHTEITIEVDTSLSSP
jgi:hypothetical protein